MEGKSFNYFALVDKKKSPGVAKKIENMVAAARGVNLEAHGYCYSTDLRGVKEFIKALLVRKSDFVMIRYSDLVSPIVFVLMIYLRVSGAKIIIDVPTPRCIGLREVDLVVSNQVTRFLRKLLMLSTGAWVFWPAHRIVQYANESRWFELGLKGKTLKIGNGILINSDLPLIESVWPSDELKMIGVAQIANWHGYDRLIRAIKKTNDMVLPCRISFTIVGDGNEREALETLVQALGLSSQVFFTGMLVGDELNQVFSDKNLGIASLGLFRIGLSEASVLKTREYMARGLPVIGVGADPDFEIESTYRYCVPNNDSEEELVELIVRLCHSEFPKPILVRRYAEKNLSLEAKIEKILSI